MKKMPALFAVPSFAAVLSLLPSAYGQVLDASKITCDQFVHGKVGNPRTVAAWLSGFYNGKRNNPLVDRETFEDRLDTLESFCYQEKNFQVPVMQAIEQGLSKPK